ncbi:hypothetical protein FACS189451_11150 [Bacteroidia bacterium]|nr:hypothetical protein FACS189451_11150 [Bacteroidia bacterium]
MCKNSALVWIVAGVLGFFAACNEKGKNEVSDSGFPKTEQLTVSKIDSVSDVYMRYPYRIRKNDSYLYVLDLLSTEYACHVFAYPTMEHKYSFAKKGNGPGEFIRVDDIRLNAEGECWVLDPNNSQISCFQYNTPNSLFKVVKLDTGLVRTLDFNLYQDSLYIVPDYTGTHRFDILSPNGKILESHGRIPIKEKDVDISDVAYGQAWRSFVSYNPDNGILAIATQLGEVLEIYSLPSGELVKVITGKGGEPQFDYMQGNMIPSGIKGYKDIFVGKENIYVIFEGHSFKDIITQKVKTEGGNRIQVFDLKGNPIKEYVLDRYISGFSIDEETGVIIGLDINDNQQIVEFNTK